MTIKERIEAFVLNQGNQVGAGAELAAILNDIVDSIPGAYTLPPATAETLGGIKVGENLSITEQGVLSASGGSSEPLIVEGTVVDTGDWGFTPKTGQPSFNEAVEAYLAGTPVILRYEHPDDLLYHETMVIDYVSDTGLSAVAVEAPASSQVPISWLKSI